MSTEGVKLVPTAAVKREALKIDLILLMEMSKHAHLCREESLSTETTRTSLVKVSRLVISEKLDVILCVTSIRVWTCVL